MRRRHWWLWTATQKLVPVFQLFLDTHSPCGVAPCLPSVPSSLLTPAYSSYSMCPTLSSYPCQSSPSVPSNLSPSLIFLITPSFFRAPGLLSPCAPTAPFIPVLQFLFLAVFLEPRCGPHWFSDSRWTLLLEPLLLSWCSDQRRALAPGHREGFGLLRATGICQRALDDFVFRASSRPPKGCWTSYCSPGPPVAEGSVSDYGLLMRFEFV